jgi:3-hydroxymyristoyl/3-hydroxydecanoyl-(acyl carrier protein) dehydratase
MPGSLGVEAMVQALQAYAGALDLGARLRAPRFAPAVGERAVWKYRGQIVRTDPPVQLEAHVRELRADADGGLTLIADGSLWKGDLRIYEVSDLAIRVVEGDAC